MQRSGPNKEPEEEEKEEGQAPEAIVATSRVLFVPRGGSRFN